MTAQNEFPMKTTVYRETKWLRFLIVDKKPKTVVIHVQNTRDQFLGAIQWQGPWRQYVFSIYTALHETLIFSAGCLDDIAKVCTDLNREHTAKARKKNGIYLLRDATGYKKTVEATFDENGKLTRLVDQDRTNYLDWEYHVLWTEPRDTHQEI